MSDRTDHKEVEYPISIEGICHPRFERIREVFEKSFVRGGEVGAAIAFYVDGELVVDLWGGHQDVQRSQPWQRDTMVNTYSTTKGMTALCAHQLIERGLLDIDRPVQAYWPEFAQAGKQDIPVRWLLTHQAGLAALRSPLPEEALYDWDRMCAALAAEPPSWEPGTRHGYHAVTFGFLVGEVIRRISGQSVGRFFETQVAEPLGVDFHIGLSEEQEARVCDLIGSLVPPESKGSKKKSKPKDRPKGPMNDFLAKMRDPTTLVGAAFNNPRITPLSVNSTQWRRAEIPAANGHGTARALARVYGALSRGGELDGVRILEPESIDFARREQVFGPDLVLGGMPMRFGLGFMLGHDMMPLSPNPNAFGHAGAGGSLAMADPDASVGFGYVMNRMQAGLVGGRTAFEVLKAFYESV